MVHGSAQVTGGPRAVGRDRRTGCCGPGGKPTCHTRCGSCRGRSRDGGSVLRGRIAGPCRGSSGSDPVPDRSRPGRAFGANGTPAAALARIAEARRRPPASCSAAGVAPQVGRESQMSATWTASGGGQFDPDTKAALAFGGRPQRAGYRCSPPVWVGRSAAPLGRRPDLSGREDGKELRFRGNWPSSSSPAAAKVRRLYAARLAQRQHPRHTSGGEGVYRVVRGTSATAARTTARLAQQSNVTPTCAGGLGDC